MTQLDGTIYYDHELGFQPLVEAYEVALSKASDSSSCRAVLVSPLFESRDFGALEPFFEASDKLFETYRIGDELDIVW